VDKEKTINFAGSIIIFFALLFVFSKWGPSLPISVFSQVKGKPFVVSGIGKVTATPNIAIVTLGIESSNVSLKAAQNQVNTKSKALTDSLKKMEIGESDIKTTSYSVYPDYDYKVSPAKIVGYRVSTSYQVKVKDFDKVNDVLIKATDAGVNSIGGVEFDLSEEIKKEKIQEARTLAVKEAKEKASGLAKASGIILGKIINVSESQNGSVAYKSYALPVAGGGDTRKENADIQPGESEISVSVSLSYEVR
jgi:uncharacterized protein